MNPVAIIAIVAQLVQLASQIREELKRTNAWTPAQEAEFQAKLDAAFASEAWKPHGKLA